MAGKHQFLINTECNTFEFTQRQRATINRAIGILETKIKYDDAFTDSSAVKRYCQLQLAGAKEEHFGCLFLDNQHRLINFEILFKGTIDGAAVYPRVVVRKSIEFNAAAVIFTHNHPSGIVKPSQSDISITRRLKQALEYIDVRVLDHIVVGTEGCSSLAEDGKL